MNTSQNNKGGSAFPLYLPQEEGDIRLGMTLRDYFAGQAIRTVEARIGQYSPEVIAERCYRLADAMLVERGIKL
jgi:hypothetical protein